MSGSSKLCTDRNKDNPAAWREKDVLELIQNPLIPGGMIKYISNAPINKTKKVTMHNGVCYLYQRTKEEML